MATKRHWRTKLTQASRLPYKVGLIQAITMYSETMEKYESAKRNTLNYAKSQRTQERSF